MDKSVVRNEKYDGDKSSRSMKKVLEKGKKSVKTRQHSILVLKLCPRGSNSLTVPTYK